MKHTIIYQDTPLAVVTVEASAFRHIVSMVEFWSDWEDRLLENEGDYVKAWLKQLGMFILRHGRAPGDDEGWTKLDGSVGINLVSWNPFEFDEYEIEIATE